MNRRLLFSFSVIFAANLASCKTSNGSDVKSEPASSQEYTSVGDSLVCHEAFSSEKGRVWLQGYLSAMMRFTGKKNLLLLNAQNDEATYLPSKSSFEGCSDGESISLHKAANAFIPKAERDYNVAVQNGVIKFDVTKLKVLGLGQTKFKDIYAQNGTQLAVWFDGFLQALLDHHNIEMTTFNVSERATFELSIGATPGQSDFENLYAFVQKQGRSSPQEKAHIIVFRALRKAKWPNVDLLKDQLGE